MSLVLRIVLTLCNDFQELAHNIVKKWASSAPLEDSVCDIWARKKSRILEFGQHERKYGAMCRECSIEVFMIV